MVVFFNDTATTEIYTLSLHGALPISQRARGPAAASRRRARLARIGLPLRADRDAARPHGHRRSPAGGLAPHHRRGAGGARSEEHTSELQSRQYIVCRLLLEKKKIFVISFGVVRSPLPTTFDTLLPFILSLLMTLPPISYEHTSYLHSLKYLLFCPLL